VISATEAAIDDVMADARRKLVVREVPRGSNRSPEIDAMNRYANAPLGSPWCCSFVVTCLAGTDNELPVTASCQHLADAAIKKGLVVPQSEARRGDIFLLWYPSLGRYAHTGFVDSGNMNGVIDTIEGNTNDGGSRDGWGVFERDRTLKPKDLIVRWS
jgi:hypothetical protein